MNTRTLPRQARSAKSLDLILDAAERLLQQRGVVETSTVEVAAAAGVSVGRLYYWFPDKDAVVEAVVSRAEHRLREYLEYSVFSHPPRKTVDMLANVLPGVCEFFAAHPGSLAVLLRGPTGGADPGKSLCHLFVELAGRVIETSVVNVGPDERDLVSNTVVRIVLAMIDEYVRADTDELRNKYLGEMQLVLGSYLCRGRYPDVRTASSPTAFHLNGSLRQPTTPHLHSVPNDLSVASLRE